MATTRNQSDEENNVHDKKLTIKKQLSIDVKAGLASGVFCSGLFNPWDRALYLSVKNNNPFLTKDNFRHPYHGFSQAIVQRAFLGSIYYIMQGELKHHLYPYLHHDLKTSETLSQFCIGSTAGSLTGLLTNSISAIKYHTWGHESRSFLVSTYDMWSHGSIKPFIKGTQATMGRDLIFGSTYEVSRHLIKNTFPKFNNTDDASLNFLCNSSAAALGTIASGPLNYVRTIQYATPPQEKPPTVLKALVDVWSESKKPDAHLLNKMSFFQQKFRIGWGTARVAIGMAVGQAVFDCVSSKLTKTIKS